MSGSQGMERLQKRKEKHFENPKGKLIDWRPCIIRWNGKQAKLESRNRQMGWLTVRVKYSPSQGQTHTHAQVSGEKSVPKQRPARMGVRTQRRASAASRWGTLGWCKSSFTWNAFSSLLLSLHSFHRTVTCPRTLLRVLLQQENLSLRKDTKNKDNKLS